MTSSENMQRVGHLQTGTESDNKRVDQEGGVSCGSVATLFIPLAILFKLAFFPWHISTSY